MPSKIDHEFSNIKIKRTSESESPYYYYNITINQVFMSQDFLYLHICD